MKNLIYILIIFLCVSSFVNASPIVGYQTNETRHYKAVYDGTRWYCSLDGVEFDRSGYTGTGGIEMIQSYLSFGSERGLLYVDNINISYGIETFCDNHPGALFCDDAETGVITDKWTVSQSTPQSPVYSSTYSSGGSRSIYMNTKPLDDMIPPPEGNPANSYISINWVANGTTFPYTISGELYDETTTSGDGYSFFGISELLTGVRYNDYTYNGDFVVIKSRTVGWHNLSIVIRSATSATLYFDGVEIYNATGINAYQEINNFFISNIATQNNLYYDNILIEGSPCVSVWQCVQYDACIPSNLITCAVVADVNVCGGNYTGNGSEFVTSCVYSQPGDGIIYETAQSDPTNVTDLKITSQASSATVDFSGVAVNVELINVSRIIVQDNFVSVDPVANPELDVPVRITMVNIDDGWHIYYDPTFGVEGDSECSFLTCTNVVYDRNARTLSFDVPGFSSYYVGTYQKSDLPLIVIDGLGTVGAEFVYWIEIVVIALILFFGLKIAIEMKK